MYYIINMPKIQMQLDETGIISFSINHMKSRKPSIVEVVLKTYKVDDTIMQTLHHRWVVDTVYNRYYHNFQVNDWNKIKDVEVELRLYEIDSENPLWFTEMMLSSKEFDDNTEYHIPSEHMQNVLIGFNKNNYVNLYGEDGVYLQVIRPNKDTITTNIISRTAKYTILAPHLETESNWDNPINIFYEVMNQKEQSINIEK